ncbi:hypothetical protein ANN_13085 [Periplaneta americana]|uniref:Uncharacterized protein n=1 Tax=Periplaneta americana TaxID=6978 RepID=A0ABQ8TKJ3_PERAM|nr:hypothetical protein ANN_13085 [Periplaneta americana]
MAGLCEAGYEPPGSLIFISGDLGGHVMKHLSLTPARPIQRSDISVFRHYDRYHSDSIFWERNSGSYGVRPSRQLTEPQLSLFDILATKTVREPRVDCL